MALELASEALKAQPRDSLQRILRSIPCRRTRKCSSPLWRRTALHWSLLPGRQEPIRRCPGSGRQALHLEPTFTALEVVAVAVDQTGTALRHTTDGLRADRITVLIAVSRDGLALRHASDELRADEETGFEMLLRHPCLYRILQYPSQEVVLTAVRQCGEALRFARAVCKARRNWQPNYGSVASLHSAKTHQVLVGVCCFCVALHQATAAVVAEAVRCQGRHFGYPKCFDLQPLL